MSTKPQLSGRLEFVDGLRGLAVLCMLVLHSAHGWLEASARMGSAWYWITSVGGMAAPLFFLLTGVGLGLRLLGGLPVDPRGELARGLGLAVLGYLLRVQMWQLDGAAIVEPPQLAAGLTLAAGHLSLFWGLRAFARRAPAAAPLWLGAACVGLGLVAAHRLAPESVPNLLRFDVLQGLGFANALLALPLAWVRSPRARVTGCLALGATLLAATPSVRAWVPGPLPLPLAAALAFWPDPTGGAPWAMFPMFPWAAYAAFGVAVGMYLRWGTERGASQLQLLAPLALMGGLLAGATSEDLDRVTGLLERQPAWTQPIRVGYRLGLGLISMGATAWLVRQRGWLSARLIDLGRASLVIYWIHLEFAFGAPSTPIHGVLNLSQWGGLLAVLTLAMMAVARVRAWHRNRVDSGRQGTARVAATNVEQGA